MSGAGRCSAGGGFAGRDLPWLMAEEEDKKRSKDFVGSRWRREMRSMATKY